MEHESHDIFELTRDQMQGYIDGGRNAIENACLLVLVRPRSPTPQDEADYQALIDLLDTYNKLMAPFGKPKLPTQSANDEKGTSE